MVSDSSERVICAIKKLILCGSAIYFCHFCHILFKGMAKELYFSQKSMWQIAYFYMAESHIFINMTSNHVEDGANDCISRLL